MDISVIVVTYNQESTIGRTLDSILSQQTEAKYEVIIGDDCSSDGTEAVCRDYAARYPDRIVYLRRSKNLGVVRNYYDCIERSRGRYLADCAGDDYWVDPRKLQRQLDVLESRPDVTLVATQWLYRDEATGKTSKAPNACPAGDFNGRKMLVPILTNSSMIHLCSALYRKEVLTEQMRQNPEIFNNSDFSCEDQQILLACAKGGRIVVLPITSLHYSIGHDSISHRSSFAAQLSYSTRSFSQFYTLLQHFMPERSGSKEKIISEFINAKADYLHALRFRSGKRGASWDLNRDQWYGLGGWKAKVYRTLTSNLWLWKTSLAFRNLFPERK